MGAAIFGIIGVIVGGLINGAVSWLAQRRKEESTALSAKRLVATELGTWVTLARAAAARPPDELPQLRNATPKIWQSNRGVLARSLGDVEWELLATAYAHVDALESVLVFNRDGVLEEWQSREAKRLLEEMLDPVEQARAALLSVGDGAKGTPPPPPPQVYAA
ncbi:MAG TPA: hypothetical protein VGQ38_02630 [Gaiellaceae bacterium]|jgi:hypothetical protein|nr:hypothetical protein [Gaiellaceae bacterium]